MHGSEASIRDQAVIVPHGFAYHHIPCTLAGKPQGKNKDLSQKSEDTIIIFVILILHKTIL